MKGPIFCILKATKDIMIIIYDLQDGTFEGKILQITKEENKPRTKRTLEVFVRRCIAELVHECANYLLDNDEGTNVIQITKLKFTGEDEDI